MKFNEDKLVKVAVLGTVSHPALAEPPYKVNPEGEIIISPSVGGIRYNFRVGDLATGLVADHVEPGVSIKNFDKRQEHNNALNILSCVGNKAKIVSGEAKGSEGVVTGKHGGIEHVLVDFNPETLEKIVIGDKVQVKAFGQGLKILDYPEVKVMNIDPGAFKKLGIKEEGENLVVPVTHQIPAKIMGSGLGRVHVYRGDYDIQLFDEGIKRKYNLGNLRIGDLVAIINADHSFGRIYKEGAISVGVVVHSDCVLAGHGPGVMTILTSKKGKIKPVLDEKANIAIKLGIRKDI